MTVKSKSRILTLLSGLLVLLISSCAVQQTPTGGEKDTEPPQLISVTPPNETLNFKAEEIEILFNEYVQLQNAFQEITISPDPETRPEFRTRKTAILVRFTDTLEENTTYQINFGKAIGDMNERNPYSNLKYVFSTGNQIDSLRIRGSVSTYTMGIDPKKNDPSSILVLIHRQQDSIAHPDSLIMMKKPGYYTYADSSGNFEITNLKEGTYRLYALKEENDSRLYDDTKELIGFLEEPLTLQGDTLLPKIHLATMEQAQLEVLNERNQDARLTILLSKRTDSLSLNV
ncbi:MAG TPA: Ig-like domain-containing protein, partial [Anseongella sp.]